MRRTRIILLGYVAWIVVHHSAVLAQISPGELSRAHQALEGVGNCTQCHESGREISGARCLNCHQEIRNQLGSGHGFHAAHATTGCVSCHKEHLGLDAAITKFDPATFDHPTTGFPLTGKHSALRCERCHTATNIHDPAVRASLNRTPRNTFLGLTAACVTCHADRHDGSVGTQCQTCHSTAGWRPVAHFTHDKTHFPLTGKHATVACSDCHAEMKGRASGVPVLFRTKSFADCTPCHASPHGKQFVGKLCSSCHTTEGWNRVSSFDHSLTNFPLVGKHLTVACTRCHTGPRDPSRPRVIAPTKPFRDCAPCHTSPHAPAFGTRLCSGCHTPSGWALAAGVRFDHTLTSFALLGAHAALACDRCHKPRAQASFAGTYRIPYQRCTDCHADAHQGQFQATYGTDCAACHTVKAYRPSTFTPDQHGKTRFPLTGAHQATPCRECHAKGGNDHSIFRFESIRCDACHADPHHGQFAREMTAQSCDRCHSTREWKAAAFDHSITGFPLEGKHRDAACAACHRDQTVNGVRTVVYQGLSKECESCHPDIHGGQFRTGTTTACARCHAPAGWHALRFNHDQQTAFPLTGAHKKVVCGACHREERMNGRAVVRYRPLAVTCESCHQRTP